MKPEVYFDSTDKFVDITNEMDVLVYPKEEIVSGHKFKHVAYGIYAAEPAFEVSEKELYEIGIENSDIEFYIEMPITDKNEPKWPTKVFFASARNWCDYIPEFKIMDRGVREDEAFRRYKEILGNKNLGVSCLYDNHPDSIEMSELTLRMRATCHQIVRREGRRSWIRLKGAIGIEVEEGIYYVLSDGPNMMNGRYENPIMGMKDEGLQDVDVAVIMCGYDWCQTYRAMKVFYVAVGKEHFPRLKRMSEVLNCEYYESLQKSEEIPELMNTEAESEEKLLSPEEGAEELVQGLGMNKLEVSFSIPLIGSSKFEEYELAYKLGDELVLVKVNEYKNPKIQKEIHQLRLMEYLYVRQARRLKCGIEYPVLYEVIDCGRDKRISELFTPEAYELLKKEKKGDL